MVLETHFFFTSTMFIDFYLWCPGKKNIEYRCSCALSLVCLGLVDIFLNVGGEINALWDTEHVDFSLYCCVL